MFETTTKDLLIEQVDGAVLTFGGVILDSDDEDYLDPLMLEWVHDWQGDWHKKPKLTRLIITVATGGPHIDVELPRGIVRGWWGSQYHETRLHPLLAEKVWDWYDELNPTNFLEVPSWGQQS